MPFGFLQAFGRPRLVPPHEPSKELRPHSSVYQSERMRFLLLLDRALSDYLPDMIKASLAYVVYPTRDK